MRVYPILIFALCGFSVASQTLTDAQIEDLVKKPENLKAEIVTKEGDQFIHLTWGNEPHEDIPELEYLIYASAFSDVLAQQGSIDIRKNSYYHPAPNRFGKSYKFQVEATYEKEYSLERSPVSDTLTIYVPSKELPNVNVWPVTKEGRVVTLYWKYSDRIDDLAGFRLYHNDELILSEEELPKDARTWQSAPLELGIHSFRIQAVSNFDVKSERSKPRSFKIIDED